MREKGIEAEKRTEEKRNQFVLKISILRDAVDLLLQAVDLFVTGFLGCSRVANGRPIDSSGRPLQGRLKVSIYRRSTY